MFDSLDEQMKRDARQEKTQKERVLEALAIVAVSIIFFVGLVFGVRMVG